MIGRLEPPGAKLEPVMPGLSNSRSPSVAAPLRRISSFGTTVTVANWSVTMGKVPGSDAGDGVAGCATAGPASELLVAWRVTMGLGALTTTSGSVVCALDFIGVPKSAHWKTASNKVRRMQIGMTSLESLTHARASAFCAAVARLMTEGRSGLRRRSGLEWLPRRVRRIVFGGIRQTTRGTRSPAMPRMAVVIEAVCRQDGSPHILYNPRGRGHDDRRHRRRCRCYGGRL